MLAAKSCANENLARTLCMIELILEDVRGNYPWIGGRGVSEIGARGFTTYVVRLPREEAVDIFTYDFVIRDGEVAMTKKTPSTESD